MIIDRKIQKYIVFDEDPIVRGLENIDANDMRVIFVVNESGMLKGIVTDGDFRRWVVKQENIDLQQPISMVANTEFKYCHDGDDLSKITNFFSERIDYVPLVDDKKRLVAVASKRKAKIIIGKHLISNESPVFVIAEVGNNHNGSIAMARQLVDEAITAGADCVKFQMRNLRKLYRNEGKANDAEEDLGSQYVLDLLDRFQLSDEELVEIFNYCKDKGVTPLCTPWDESSVDFLDQWGMEAFKVASADLINHDLLTAIAAKGKPMICSTGMSTEQEIRAAIGLLQKLGAQFLLLHCNSTYPAPFKDINLHYIDRLHELSSTPVGYSGHERGGQVGIAAVALGAKIIEKHFTLDRSLEGNDHKVSLLPDEFRSMVQGIRDVEQALGSDESRTVSQGELINRESLAKSLVINRNLKEGEVITSDMVEVKSPGKGIPPYRKNDLVGTKANRDFAKGDFFYSEDLDNKIVRPGNFQFIHPFGVPVRYHDIKSIADSCEMDLLEIHMSYKDLEIDITQFFDRQFPHQLIVHSPELFAGDHILDLCADDPVYRARSIQELQRVVNITEELMPFFPATISPPIVVNVGGFSADGFISEHERISKYDLLVESLAMVNQRSTEIIPQTMPPFPWHFGGQRFHNLFVDIDEIVSFCTEYNYRICFDLSHSKLACNYRKCSFLEFLKKVAPVTAHMHIADAQGVDGEGLQIGEGEIDFKLIMTELKTIMPDVSFIPEIWQGHKNKGQGFWIALNRLKDAAGGL